MKQSINKTQFRDAFIQMGRKDQFSYDALGLLFDHFESLEDEMDKEIELDVIAICCEYAENNTDEIVDIYNLQKHVEGEDESFKKDFVHEYLIDNTSFVAETDTGFVYQQF